MFSQEDAANVFTIFIRTNKDKRNLCIQINTEIAKVYHIVAVAAVIRAFSDRTSGNVTRIF
ncbi:hypothetical protein CSQ92_10155 [Janthinobacterium sp. BJB446]|nr:hypothetical protein CSQ92_10155 [Janthinobacterium sp. BJB446]